MKKLMLAVLGNESILSDKNFIFEPKLDGFRALCYKKGNEVKFFSRNDNDLTQRFPELKISKNINAKSAIIDGEIVIFNNKGIPEFQLIQSRSDNPNLIFNPAVFVAFDILEKDNSSLLDLPLTERKKILESTIKEGEFIQINFFSNDGKKLWKEIRKIGGEGVMAKKKSGKYILGRSSDWIKVKFNKTLDAVVIGYTKGKRQISSLVLGLYRRERDAKKLEYIGKVGTGFNEKILSELKKIFKMLETKKINVDISSKSIVWLEPKLVAEIKYLEFTRDKILRAPVFLRLRDDKFPEECVIT